MVVGQKLMTSDAFIPMTQIPMTNANPIAMIPVFSLYFHPTRMEITIARMQSHKAITKSPFVIF